MNTLSQVSIALSHVDKNKIAATLSIIPGLGHLYKYHFVSGIAIMGAGNLGMLWLTNWLSYAYFGPAVLIIPACYWVAAMANAYYAPDRRGAHQYVTPWRQIDPREIVAERKAAAEAEPIVGEGMNGDGV